MIEGMRNIGFDLTHAYGLTETYGPAAAAAKRQNWASEASPSRRGSTAGRACATRCRRA